MIKRELLCWSPGQALWSIVCMPYSPWSDLVVRHPLLRACPVLQTDWDWALLVLPLWLCLVVKIILERLLAEVLEARPERLGWIAVRRSSSAVKKPSLFGGYAQCQGPTPKITSRPVNTSCLPPRAPHFYMSLVDHAASVKSKTHPCPLFCWVNLTKVTEYWCFRNSVFKFFEGIFLLMSPDPLGILA